MNLDCTRAEITAIAPLSDGHRNLLITGGYQSGRNRQHETDGNAGGVGRQVPGLGPHRMWQWPGEQIQNTWG